MPRDFKRTDRISDAIQKAVAMIIQQEMKDLLGMITISEVSVSKDLAHAKIYVNVFPDEKGVESVKILNQASTFIRGLLAKQMKMRVTPQLRFIYDDTTLKANKLSRMIDEACRTDKKNES